VVPDRRLYDKAGKGGKNRAAVAAAATYSPPTSNAANEADALGMNSRSIVLIALLFVLLMYVAHCTYVTSNAYSHPSVVLQSHTSDGYAIEVFTA